jgi:hypothetical protein
LYKEISNFFWCVQHYILLKYDIPY